MIILDPIIRILLIAINLYIWVVIISAILSWLVAFNVINTSNQFVRALGEFLWRITEPALRPVRRFIPSFGGVDISPVVLILVLLFAQMVLANIHRALLTNF